MQLEPVVWNSSGPPLPPRIPAVRAPGKQICWKGETNECSFHMVWDTSRLHIDPQFSALPVKQGLCSLSPTLSDGPRLEPPEYNRTCESILEPAALF